MYIRKLNRKHLFLFIVLIVSGILPTALKAQDSGIDQDTTRRNAVRLFIDCQGGCDMNYIREKIPYVNYVRDVHEAQLYLLITRQSTGGGGREYTLYYSGLQEFTGMNDTLKYFSSADDTQDAVRMGLTGTLALGLVRYVAKTPFRNRLLISYMGERQETPQQVADSWNYWVFQIDVQPKLKLEKRNKEFSWDLEIDIDRITADWKVENGFEYDHQLEVFIRDKFDVETGEYRETRTEAITKSWEIDNLTVKSLSEHWSAGMRFEAGSSTYRNIRFNTSLMPALEYNIFPYSQYNHRQLTFLYGLGYLYNNYVDTTVYNKLSESHFQQSLDVRLRVQQKWGYSEISLNASSLLSDININYAELDGNINLRLFRGFSLSVRGMMAFIHNQIELPKGDRTDEEVYLRLRELETNYRYELGIGLKYTFGSIYSNIVNPRF